MTLLGVRVLGGTAAWVPPTGWSTWARLEEVWRGTVGDFNGVGLYQRPQATRSGLAALLINDERPVAFVRLQYLDDDQTMAHLRREHDVLTALDEAQVNAFEHPHPMAVDTLDDWGYLLTSAVSGLDRPAARDPVQAITDDIVTDSLA